MSGVISTKDINTIRWPWYRAVGAIPLFLYLLVNFLGVIGEFYLGFVHPWFGPLILATGWSLIAGQFIWLCYFGTRYESRDIRVCWRKPPRKEYNRLHLSLWLPTVIAVMSSVFSVFCWLLVVFILRSSTGMILGATIWLGASFVCTIPLTLIAITIQLELRRRFLENVKCRRICYECGYDLHACRTPACPECGEAIPWLNHTCPRVVQAG